MTTLFDLLLKTADRLRGGRYGTATGGSTTTLVDTLLVESNDFFNGGTLFHLTGNNANKSAVITDWNSSTFTFTIPTQAGANAAGVQYAVFPKRFRRDAMVEAINQALADLGPFDQIDETLTVVEDQEVYTLPTGIYDVKQVHIATNDAAPYDWQIYHYFREQNGSLYFGDQHLPLTAGRKIRILYRAPHARVSADADTITDAASPELIAAGAAFFAAKNKAAQAGSSDGEAQATLNIIGPEYEMLKRKHPVQRRQQTPRWPNWMPEQKIW